MEAVSDTPVPPELVAGSAVLADALALARDAHEGQLRKGDGSPYVSHPITVAGLVAEAGHDDSVVAAALLHDVVEDSPITADEIAERFGERTGMLVAALTEDESILRYAARKDEHRQRVETGGPEAAVIYAADKLANLRDMRRLYAEVGERAAERFTAPLDLRVRLWRADAEMVASALGDTDLVHALRFELEAFQAQRARARG